MQTGIGLLGADCWTQQYDIALALHEEAAEAAYFIGDYERMKQWVDIVLQQAKTVLDSVNAYKVEIQSYSAQDKLMEGVQIGLRILSRLGIELPAQPSQEDVQRGLEETLAAWPGQNIEDLADLPTMTEPATLAVMSILSTLYVPAFSTLPELYGLIVFNQVRLSVKYGNTPGSAGAYVAFGLILCGQGHIAIGYQFGRLALNLMERLKTQEIKSLTVYIMNNFVRIWKDPIQQIVPLNLEAYQSGLETGNFDFASANVFGYISLSYWSGLELTALERNATKYAEVIHRLKQGPSLMLLELHHQVMLNLMGRADNPCRLMGTSFDEATTLPLLRQPDNLTVICVLHVHKMILCYLFRDYREAMESAAICETYEQVLAGRIYHPMFHFYASLMRLAVLPDAEGSEPERLLIKVAASQEKMKLWAEYAPMNFLHKFYLVEAERARVSGNVSDARDDYDQAIALAHENAYIQEEALANELAGKFYLARGQPHVARHYLYDVHYAYQRWGAVAKVKDLEACYPQFLLQHEARSRQTVSTTSTTSPSPTSRTLDLTSVLKAAQAISSEIVLDKLLDTLMNTVIENAGAQKGCSSWNIKASW